mmetsp:Transcript_17967/g.27206  ORF Transcript_17967/g.27206 Transcript_17967/m.27206 type:complete len:141 (+) Transcript_17967:47-469(+)
MPSVSDRCIQALQKWVPRYASNLYPLHEQTSNPGGGSGGGVELNGDYDAKTQTTMIPALAPERLFDRYEQHTSHCIECQNALKQFPKWRRNMYGLLTLSVVFWRFTLARVTALLSMGLLRLIQKAENHMLKGGFKHYENH